MLATAPALHDKPSGAQCSKLSPQSVKLQRQVTSWMSHSESFAAKRGAAPNNRSCAARCLQFGIIDPRSNTLIAYWDLITTLALVFTAIVTPVEVAFLPPPLASQRWADPLFLCNRSIDAIFILDMLLQCARNGHLKPHASARCRAPTAPQHARADPARACGPRSPLICLVCGFLAAVRPVDPRLGRLRIAYSAQGVEGVRWVLDGVSIARHYLCSHWFGLDLFSILTSLFDVLGDESTGDLKALRAVRTLRLIKLVKLARGSRIFKRWEMRLSINYGGLTLAVVVTVIFLACHWFACVWGLQASFDPLRSWFAAVDYCAPWGDANHTVALQMACPEGWSCNVGECGDDGVCARGFACAGAHDLYVYSLCAVPRIRHHPMPTRSAAPAHICHHRSGALRSPSALSCECTVGAAGPLPLPCAPPLPYAPLSHVPPPLPYTPSP